MLPNAHKPAGNPSHAPSMMLGACRPVGCLPPPGVPPEGALWGSVMTAGAVVAPALVRQAGRVPSTRRPRRRTFGMRARAEWIVRGGFMESEGYQAMKRLLDVRPKIDAVFAANDPSAIGAMLRSSEPFLLTRSINEWSMALPE